MEGIRRNDSMDCARDEKLGVSGVSPNPESLESVTPQNCYFRRRDKCHLFHDVCGKQFGKVLTDVGKAVTVVRRIDVLVDCFDQFNGEVVEARWWGSGSGVYELVNKLRGQ